MTKTEAIYILNEFKKTCRERHCGDCPFYLTRYETCGFFRVMNEITDLEDGEVRVEFKIPSLWDTNELED